MISLLTDKKTYISGDVLGTKYNVPYEAQLYTDLKVLQDTSDACEDRKDFDEVCEKFLAKLKENEEADETFGGLDNVVRARRTGKLHLSFAKDITSKLYFPKKLEDMMESNLAEGIDNTPIVKVVESFMFNPKPTQKRLDMLANYITATYVDEEVLEKLIDDGYSYDVAKERATYMDLQITKEGFIKTTKVATELTKKWSVVVEDGKPVRDENGNPKKELVDRYATAITIDEETGEITEETKFPEFLEDRVFKPAIYPNGDKFFSGDVIGYKYEVGKLASLRDWNLIDTKDNSKHQRGLHTGGLAYIKSYLRGNRELLNCFICPSMIGKFTDEGVGEMTVLEMFIYDCSTLKETTKGLFHPAKYQEIRREKFEEGLREQSKEFAESVSDLKSTSDVNAALYKSLFQQDLVLTDGETKQE